MKNKRIVVIDSRMSEKCKRSLANFGYELIEIPSDLRYDEPVSAHPDIFLFVHNRTLVLNRGVLSELEHLFKAGDFDYYIIDKIGDRILYPNDCSLNFAVCGKYIIGNKKVCNEHILDIANSNTLQFIDVKQGYAKCNICIVSDNAIITEDKGIAKACTENGIDVLLLETNSVKLDGYKNGFIGGATGTVLSDNGNIVYFCGDVTEHKEFLKIKSFCDKHNADIVSLSDEPLYDRGSIIFL